MWLFNYAAVACVVGLQVVGAKRPVFLYVNTNFQNWSDACIDIRYMIDQGATEVLLAFWLNSGDADAVIAWSWIEDKQACLDYAHERGAKILLAAAGATDEPYYTVTGEDYGTRAAQAAIDHQLDGVDFDLELLPAGFGDQLHYQWLIDCTLAARKVFDEKSTIGHMIITHAPQAPYFAAWAGSNKGYVQLMKDLGDAVDYYLVQYYNQGACQYLTYDSIFKATEAGCWSAGASILEIKAALGPAHEHLWTKLVVGKPATKDDVVNTGMVQPADLAAAVCTAEQNDGYVGGVMAWSYRGMHHAAMNDFFTHVPGASCGDSGTPAPTTNPIPTTAATPVPTTAATPIPTTAAALAPTTAVALAPTTAATPVPTTAAALAPTTAAALAPTTAAALAPTTAPIIVPTAVATTGASVDPSLTTVPSTSKCFHNEASFWWTADCSDSSICMEDLSLTSSDACLSSGFPHATWIGSVDECRSIVYKRGGCAELGNTTPATKPPPTAGNSGCYHNEANFYWTDDCSSKKLCMFDGAFSTPADCTSSGYPNAYYGTEVECRNFVKSQGGCVQ